MALLGARRDLGARLGKLAQALFPQRKLIGDRKAIGKIGLIGRFGLRHQVGNLGLQLRFDLASMLIRKRAVPAGIGVNLRPVKTDRAHLQNAHLARQKQHLHEQTLDLLEKAPPKRRYRVVIGMIVRRDEPEGHRVIRRPFELAARKHPRRITINQKPDQNLRMIRRRTRATIAAAHRTQVKALDYLHNKPRQVLLGKPLIHRRRQKKAGLTIHHSKIRSSHNQHMALENQSLHSSRYPGDALSPTGC